MNPVIKICIVWNPKTKVWDVGMHRENKGLISFNASYLQDATAQIQRYMEQKDNWPQ